MNRIDTNTIAVLHKFPKATKYHDIMITLLDLNVELVSSSTFHQANDKHYWTTFNIQIKTL